MGFSQRKHYIALQHPEILEKYIGAEIKGEQKNTQAALLEEFFQRAVSGNDQQGDPVKYLIMNDIGMSITKFESHDHVVMQMKTPNWNVIHSLFDNIEEAEALTLVFFSMRMKLVIFSY